MENLFERISRFLRALPVPFFALSIIKQKPLRTQNSFCGKISGKEKNQRHSYLIIKLGALGDVAMSLAALRELKSVPGTKVTWVAGESVVPLLELSNLVDEIIIADSPALLGSNKILAACAVLSVCRKLWGRKFDLCLIPYRDWRYNFLRLGAWCKTVCSFRPKANLIPGRYHGSEYMRLASGGNVCSDVENLFPDLCLPSKGAMQVPDILLAPGGSFNASKGDVKRRWPVEHYVKFAQMALDSNLTVGIIGSGDDAELEKEFSELPVTSFINKTTLVELLSILRETRLLITHDSGPMHLMALVGRPMIALFGPTLAMEKIISSHRAKVLHSPRPLLCRPCYDGKRYAKCSSNFCMTEILPDRVFSEALILLKEAEAENTGEKPQISFNVQSLDERL